jgi:hypothetical protein
VQGVGHQFGGENTLRAAWLPALKDGLARADQRFASDDDLGCAFYGNLFRPEGKPAINPPLDASDVADEWEQEQLELWWREAARVDPSVHGPDADTKLSTPYIVHDALSHSRFFAGLAESALIFDLKQVRRYLDDPEVRRAARVSIERAIGPETTVIIAHSLGSIVAYEALCDHPAWPVHTFVTIGSPLGIRNLIFEKLQPIPSRGRGRLATGNCAVVQHRGQG